MMKQRGRPHQHDSQPGWMLTRTEEVLIGYDGARRNGEKREAAIDAAIQHVRDRQPDMPISRSVVQRILKDFRGRGMGKGLVIRERLAPLAEVFPTFVIPAGFEESMNQFHPPLPDKSGMIRVITGYCEELPRLPRSNARRLCW